VTPGLIKGGIFAGRVLHRTATRLAPPLFQKAQRAAWQAVEEIKEPLAMEAGRATRLFAKAKQLGGRIDLRETAETIDKLSRRIPPSPASREAQAMQRALESARTVFSEGGKVDLMRFEAVRRDLGALIRETGSPEAKALYNALLRDLEKAAESGTVRPVVRVGPEGPRVVGTRTQPVPGAQALQRALEAARSERALLELDDIISRATKIRTVSGNDFPVLQVPEITKALRRPETREALEHFGGPELVRTLEAFVERFRTLPPDLAFNAWNRMLAILGASPGVATGRPIAAAVGATVAGLAPEILENIRIVGANPERLERLLTVVAQTARGAAESAGLELPKVIARPVSAALDMPSEMVESGVRALGAPEPVAVGAGILAGMALPPGGGGGGARRVEQIVSRTVRETAERSAKLGQLWQDAAVLADPERSPISRTTWAILTAQKSGMSPAEVKAANEALERQLRAKGYQPLRVKGFFKGETEDSFLVPGLAPKEAFELGRQWRQDSVLTHHGLIGTNPANRDEFGKLFPIKPQETVVGEAARQREAYTVLQVGDRELPFSVGINFEAPRPAFESVPMREARRALVERAMKAGATSESSVIAPLHRVERLFRLGEFRVDWYHGAWSDLVEKFGEKDADLIVRLIAATSPNMRPDDNVKLAYRIYRDVVKGGKSLDEVFPIVEGKSKGLMPDVRKNVEIVLAGGLPGGAKVENFYRAIFGDPNAVVIDIWMIRGLAPGLAKAIKKAVDEGERASKAITLTDAQYEFLANRVRAIAERVGVSPRDVQAAIWSGRKRLAALRKSDPFFDKITHADAKEAFYDGVPPEDIPKAIIPALRQILATHMPMLKDLGIHDRAVGAALILGLFAQPLFEAAPEQ
jgi:hypothetical protein